MLEPNRAALERSHPDVLRRLLAARPAGSCRPAPAPPGRALPYLADAGEVIVFGFGTGETLEAVRRAAREDARISVVVLDPRRALSTLRRHDRSAALSDRRVRLLCGDLQTVVRSMPPADETLTVVVDPEGVAGAAPELRPLSAMALELEATQRSRRSQILEVLDNLERNLDAIVDSPPAAALRSVLAGRPVMLVAPGPSLDGLLGVLRDADPRPYVVALDTALRPLARAGVAPDLAVTLDPTPGNRAKFDGVPLDCPLVFFGGARPEAVGRAPLRLFACERGGLLDGAHPGFGRHGAYASDGSVLTAALGVLLEAGAAPVVLVGSDLAYTGGRTHAGTVAGSRTARGEREVPDKNGGTVATSESLWRHWRRLERRLAGLPPGRVLDATPAGARIDARRVELAAWLGGQREAPARPLATALSGLTPLPDGEREELRRAAVEAIARARAGTGADAGGSARS